MSQKKKPEDKFLILDIFAKMIKLLNGSVYSNNELNKEVVAKNSDIIKEEAKKGEIFLLWKQKIFDKMIFLSVIEKVNENGFTAELFRIDIEHKNSHQRDDMRFTDMNVLDFDVFVLNKQEAQPYLNGLIVAGLQG